MNHVYIEKGRPLFKGIKNLGPFNLVNRSYRSKLFWLTKSSTNAATYGTVALYKPKRKLKLLKLTYATVKKLIENPNTSDNLRKLLEHTWGGPTNTYFNQYMKMSSFAWQAFLSKYRGLMENYDPVTGMVTSKPMNQINSIWKNSQGNPIRAGRISILNMNVKTYGLLRNKFSDKYDGIWSPAVRSPFHGSGGRNKFGAELVIFNPDEVLDKQLYPEENLRRNFTKKMNNNSVERAKAYSRRYPRSNSIVGAGSLIYAAKPRGRNTQNVIAAKRHERFWKGAENHNNGRLSGPGKAFFKNNNSVVNTGSLFKNNSRRN